MQGASSVLSSVDMEKKNLVQILKHVLRDVVDLSLCTGTTTVDNQHELLTQLFVILDHILLHGYRPRKKASTVFYQWEQPNAWAMLSDLSRFSSEAKIITRSVSEMPDIRTNLGRQRAWLRLALIEKRLCEYFRIAVENKDSFLTEFYESNALLMDEESGVLVAGLLVSLNVLDCNLCLKGAPFDSPLAPVYYAPFLREDSDDARGALLRSSLAEAKASDQFGNSTENGYASTLSDQKAYLEELNKHLSSQVGALQSRLAQTEEELKTCRSQLQSHSDADEAEASRVRTIDQLYAAAECRKAELEGELRKSITQSEATVKELNAHEALIRKLEKDVTEKNELIELLRRQLDDLKQMNIDLFGKAQTLEHNIDAVKRERAKLDERVERLKIENAELEKRVHNFEADGGRAEKLAQLVSAKEAHCAALDADLRIEREWREALTKQLSETRASVDAAQSELVVARQKAARLIEVEHEFALLQRTCSEQEQAISELSVKLGEAHLRSDELRERADGSDVKKIASDPLPARTKSPTPSSGSYSQAQPTLGSPPTTTNWVDDREALQCAACSRIFNISRRKHHCRVCGGVFCNDCSDNRIQLASQSKLVRACERCYVDQLKQAHCNAIKSD